VRLLPDSDGYDMPDDREPAAANQGQFFRELDTQILVHELKSPLSLIEATARTLLAPGSRLGPLTERQERALQRILRGAVRGRALVNHLLEIGRAESAQFDLASFDPVDAVLQIVLDAVESVDGDLAGRLSAQETDDRKLAVLSAAGINLSVAPGVENLTVHQDAVKFDLIVGNLVQNALRFRRQQLDVVLDREGDTLMVSVRDDGPGIAPDHHKVVFQRYKRVTAQDDFERPGHGLGLAGALVLARRLGGDISLQSVPDQGATFRLSVPIGAAPANERASRRS
jgi:signal transduction histidine kinase